MVLASCAADLGSAARDERIDADAIVRLSDTFAVAARRTPAGAQVVAFVQDGAGGWVAQVVASGDGAGTTAHLVTMGGETGDDWNSYLYGTAPDSASRVVVDGFTAVGGQVSNGAWVLAFRQTDLLPDQLSWDVVDATGLIIESRVGIAP